MQTQMRGLVHDGQCGAHGCETHGSKSHLKFRAPLRACERLNRVSLKKFAMPGSPFGLEGREYGREPFVALTLCPDQRVRVDMR